MISEIKFDKVHLHPPSVTHNHEKCNQASPALLVMVWVPFSEMGGVISSVCATPCHFLMVPSGTVIAERECVDFCVTGTEKRRKQDQDTGSIF